MKKKELKEIIKVYSFEVNWLKNKNKQLEKDKAGVSNNDSSVHLHCKDSDKIKVEL